MRIRFALPFATGMLLATTAHADWHAAASACAESAAQRFRCASCSALWAEIALCAATQEGSSTALASDCIQRVNNEAWGRPMYYDRVAAVFACLNK